MKKQLVLKLSGLVLVPMVVFAAAEYDLQKGVDMSGKSSISGSQLNQLVDAGTVASNKGMVIRSATSPDIINNPRYTNFVWMDVSSGSPLLKVYNGAAWVSAATGSGSVDSNSLAANAVVSGKIAASAVWRTNINDLAIDSTKIANYTIIGQNIAAGAIGYDKIAVGAVGTDSVTNQGITAAKIADGNVTTDKIADLNVTAGKIAIGAVTATKIPVQTIGVPHLDTNTFLYAYVAADGTIKKGGGICTATAVNSKGVSTLTFCTPRTSTNYIVQISGWYQTDATGIAPFVTSNFTTSVSIVMHFNDGTGTPAAGTTPFYVTIFDPQ